MNPRRAPRRVNTGPRPDRTKSSRGLAAVFPGDADVNRDQNDGDDDSDQKRGERESAALRWVGQLVRDPRSAKGPNGAKQNRHDDADILPTRQYEARKRSDDQPNEDCTDNRPDHFRSFAVGFRLPVSADPTQMAAAKCLGKAEDHRGRVHRWPSSAQACGYFLKAS